MSTLAAQQRALAAAIVDAADAAALLGASAARLDVYRAAYPSRLVAALADNHPVLQRLLGDAAFDALGRAYLVACPSRQPSIRWFGHRLAEFMEQDRPDLVAHPAFVDVARMEWALRGAFDAPDAPTLDVAAVAAVAPAAWPALRFTLHPSVQRLALDWRVEPAWRALVGFVAERGDVEPELPAPEPLAHVLLVWRQGLETRWRSLDADEATLFDALAAGERFARLGELAAQRGAPDDAAARVASLLHRWVQDGCLSALHTD